MSNVEPISPRPTSWVRRSIASTPSKLLIIAAIALAIQKAQGWWAGYLVDVTAGLGIIFPLFFLAVALIPIIIVAIGIICMFRSAISLTERTALLVISILFVVLQFTLPPLEMSGFKARMSQFDESEFLALAEAILVHQRTNGGSRARFGHDIAEALKGDHPLLRVSTWQPKIFVGPESVEIRWGSGVAGAMAVQVTNGDSKLPIDRDVNASKDLYEHVRLVMVH